MSSRSRMDMHQSARQGYSRDENVPPDSHSGNGASSVTESAYTTSVSRLKNRFQTEDAKMPVAKNPPTGRIGYPGIASPDIKRRKEEQAAALHTARNPRGTEPPIDPRQIDPQKFFETTNHVQRFQYTRAIFAKMEEQNSGGRPQQQQEGRPASAGRMGSRSRSPARPTSPGGKPGSPVRPITPPGVEIERRARSSSDSTAFEQEAERVIRDEQKRQYRAGSVDRLDDDRDYEPRHYQKAENVHVTAISKSETDLTKSGTSLSRSDSDVVQTKVPSPKWLMKHYETEANKHSTTSGRPTQPAYTRPNYKSYLGRNAGNRDPKSAPAGNNDAQATSPTESSANSGKRTSQSGYLQNVREASPEPRQASQPGYKRETSRESLRSTHAETSPEARSSATSTHRQGSQVDTHHGHNAGYRREGSPDPAAADQYTRHRQDSSPTSRTAAPPVPNYSQHPRMHAEDNRYSKDTVQMRNQINRDASTLAAGVLLPKRRSRDENGLSKEDIEASLHAVDKYWESRVDQTPSGLDHRMTESTYSSGSGEEMARSDSNHELSPASPTTPTENTPGWASKYSIQSPAKPEEIIPANVARALDHGEPDYDGGYVSTTRSSPYISPSEPVTSTVSGTLNDRLAGKTPTIMETSADDPDYVAITADHQAPTTTTTTTTAAAENVIHSLGITRHKSPAESSVSSMTPSEQDLLLSEDVQETDDDSFFKREDGDGHEEPAGVIPDQTGNDEDEGVEMVNQIWDQYFDYSYQHRSRLEPVGDQVQVLDDGSYWYEIEGIGEVDPHEDQEYPTAHKPSRVSFTNNNIKVFSTYSVEEYDRKNEDVDPMAASAEYELEKRVEKMDLSEVELNKGPEGLGLSIIGMGVGADAGLEKLGIFIKTLTDGGAASRDGRIQVNDQIIEVDGKSLVGVTQAYAASVLRNTNGTVTFMIGREKDPSKSEVARLIQQSIEQDRMRLEVRERQMRQRIDDMQQQQPAALAEAEDLEEEEKISPPFVDSLPLDYEHRNGTDDMPPLPPSSPPLVDEEMEKMLEGAPSPLDTPVRDRDFMEDSSSEGATPDMDSQVLFIKLKEAQYKNAVSEAELAKVRAKMILLENAESQKKLLEKKNEDLSKRLLDNDKILTITQKELCKCQDFMQDSQGQYISLEQEHNAEYNALEKKYHKAKKLIKEYQLKEIEYQEEREATYQQGVEKDLYYNKIAKSLKDRIFELEKDLGEALRAAGLPPVIPKDKQEVVMAAAPIESRPRPKDIKPVQPDGISQLSEDDVNVSSPDYSPDAVDGFTSSVTSASAPVLNGHNREDRIVQDLNAVPETQLLDTSASKDKAQLANSGALASRRKPTKPRSGSLNSQSNDEEDDPFFQHDSDGTVKKNTNYKKRPVSEETRSYVQSNHVAYNRYSGGYQYASEPASDWCSQAEADDYSVFNEDDGSDSSSTSQTSYDPSQPMFSGREDEIPSSIEGASSQDGGITLISAKPRESASDTKRGLFGLKSSASSSSTGDGGIQLISKKPLPNDFDDGNSGSVTLVTSRQIDTGYGQSKAPASTGNSTSNMVGEYDHESKNQTYDFASGTLSVDDSSSVSSSGSGSRRAQYQASPVQDWSPQQVCHWLLALELDQYANDFMAKGVNGALLLQLDNNRIKSLGVTNSKDRDTLKKKIKELKSAIEREKKQQEKERKAREKLESQANPKKKKMFNK